MATLFWDGWVLGVPRCVCHVGGLVRVCSGDGDRAAGISLSGLTYEFALVVVGLAVLGVAVLPRLLAGQPLSYPIVFVVLGYLLFQLPTGLGAPNAVRDSVLIERVSELAVIVALTGAGLTLNRRPGWERWRSTVRLLLITMPLTIAGVGLLGWWFLGLTPAAAMLLGAVLAPTDPVLASDVQVQGPQTDPEHADDPEIRFALTSEAGLNDGLAFPFTNAAIAMAIAGPALGNWFVDWLWLDVFVEVSVGVLAGYLAGWGLGYMLFRLPITGQLAETSEGVVALGMTLLVYGLTEMLHGYGFLAVFIAAVVVRDGERSHEYHAVLHSFADQAERLLSALMLLALGAAISTGLLGALTWRSVFFAVLVLFVIRPVAGALGMWRLPFPRNERFTIAFFGIRGIGSIYYLSHALNEANFSAEETELWSLVGLIILGSIFIHGITAAPWLRHLPESSR